MSTVPTRQAVIPPDTLGDRLMRARRTTGLTREQFAEEIGVHANSVRNYEAGRTRPLNVVLHAWSLRTGVPREWLLTGITPPEPPPLDPGKRGRTQRKRSSAWTTMNAGCDLPLLRDAVAA